MPPCIDAYGLTDARTMDAAWRFVERWAEASEKTRTWTIAFDDDRTDLAVPDLRAALAPGLKDPKRRYSLYLKGSGAESAVVSFTGDGKLVLGLSVDDAEGGEGPMRRTRELLEALRTVHGCRLGFALGEEPPPADEAAFRARMRDAAASGESMPTFGA